MKERFEKRIQELQDRILHAKGDTETTLRRAVQKYAAQHRGIQGKETQPLPEELMSYVEKVALHAYNVNDSDVETLKRAGYSEDAIFEITICAAFGAGLARLERGLAALKGEL